MDALEKLKAAYDPENFRSAGHMLVDKMADYLKTAYEGRSLTVLPDKRPEELVDKYREFLGSNQSFEDLIDEVLSDSNHLHDPGYMGHQVCAPLPLTSLSALTGALLNNGSAVYEMGMANVAMEKIVVEITAKHINYGEEADGILTSGGSLGNLTALLAARQNKASNNVWSEGHNESDLPVFLVSEQAHYCIARSVRIMGLGEKGVETIPCDENFRMRMDLIPGIIDKIIRSGRKPVCLTASAASTATGTYDDLDKAAELCKMHGLWFHVDGAHGAPVIFSPKYRQLAKGIEKADSVVIDFHKMAMTPGLNTAVVFKKGSSSYETFAQKASYLFKKENEAEWFNFAKRTMECTKSMMGLNVFTLLHAHGSEIIAANVERLYELAAIFAKMLKKSDFLELLTNPQSNIVCFRYKSDKLSNEELDSLNLYIREALIKEGDFYIVQTFLQDKWFLRITVMNPFTTKEDFANLIGHIKKIAEHKTLNE